ncbi:MAG: 50S ribosomal protein L13 [Treponemataceae bacterium]
MKTIFIKDQDIQKKWYLVDAEGKTLGRVAAKVASLLRGKHKVTFSPHQDCGDCVVVINAGKVVVSGNKHDAKLYQHHSGYVGGLKTTNFKELIERKPTEPLFLAIKGMLPNGRLGRQVINNLKIYAGTEHSHEAQAPEKIEF